MVSDNTLFFQIAAGLIPLLLFAGGFNDSLRARLNLSKQVARTRWTVISIIAFVVAVTVLGEFFAISAAVSADLVPSALRTTFVADVLALETLLLGVGFLLPWLPDTPFVGLALAVAVVIGTTLGLWMLGDAVSTANSRRSAMLAHCVRKFALDEQAAILTGQDHLDRASQRSLAVDARSAELRRKSKTLPPARVRSEFRAIQEERQRVEALYKAASDYLKSALELEFSNSSGDIEETFAETTGC